MLRRHYGLWLLVALIIGFCLGSGIKTAWEHNRFIVGSWQTQTPILVVCPCSSVTRYRVGNAVQWWGIRGYEVKSVHWDDDNTVCSKGKFVDGVIFIRGEGEREKGTYAVTSRIMIINDMRSASILLPNGNTHMPRLLEHEMGHAFGMSHVDITGHMMHAIYEYGGDRFWIPD